MTKQQISVGIFAIAIATGVLIAAKVAPAKPNIALAAIEQTIPSGAGKFNFRAQSKNLTQHVDPELVDLDSQIVSCDANVDGMTTGAGMSGSCNDSSTIAAASVAGKYMSGQCCGALMDTDDYHKNLQILQAYKSMPGIPLDPMRVPVEMAKKWIDYDHATTLSAAQQATFDSAYALSKEKPCCCKCWHYYMNEGVAKAMIKDGTFTAQQIAAFWDASDICG